jgi:hypothetical protein
MNTPKPLPSQAHLQELFEYQADTGRLVWKLRLCSEFAKASDWKRWNSQRAGQRAGTINGSTGYRVICIASQFYGEHRLIWQYVHGECPEQIDHINGVRNDNRLANLRPADPSINQRNVALRRDNASGVVGVHWDKHQQNWVAKGGGGYLGRFPSKRDAIEVRRRFEAEHGYHPNHGRLVSK